MRNAVIGFVGLGLLLSLHLSVAGQPEHPRGVPGKEEISGITAEVRKLQGQMDGLAGRLLRALRSADEELRYEAAKALAEFGPAAARTGTPTELIEAACDDRSPRVRAAAFKALNGMGRASPAAHQTRLDAARGDPDPDVRWYAVAGLSVTGAPAGQAVPLLTAIVKNTALSKPPDPTRASVRHMALRALGDYGAAAATAAPALWEIVRTDDDPDRRQAFVSLARIPAEQPKVIDHARRLLAGSEPTRADWSLGLAPVSVLGPDAAPLAPQLLRHFRWAVANPGDPRLPRPIDGVCSLLEKIGPGAKAAIPDLIAVYVNKDEDQYIRRATVRTLEAVGGDDPDVLDKLLAGYGYDVNSRSFNENPIARVAARQGEKGVRKVVKAMADLPLSDRWPFCDLLGAMGRHAESAIPDLEPLTNLKGGVVDVRTPAGAKAAIERINRDVALRGSVLKKD